MRCQQCGAFLECIIGRMYYPCINGCESVPDKPTADAAMKVYYLYDPDPCDWDVHVFNDTKYATDFEHSHRSLIPVRLSGSYEVEYNCDGPFSHTHRITPMPEAYLIRVRE